MRKLWWLVGLMILAALWRFGCAPRRTFPDLEVAPVTYPSSRDPLDLFAGDRVLHEALS